MKYICKPNKNARCLCGTSSGYAGTIACQSGCNTGGKAFAFYLPYPDMHLILKPGFDINITPGADSIEIHRWSQVPNTSFNGRQLHAKISHTGGEVELDINSTYRWISVFARNPSKGNIYDGCCFHMSGNAITLLSF
jgi:hypothetical protein